MATEDDTVETQWLKLDKANKNDRVDMIRKIVKQGTEEKDKLGRTLLHYAAHHGNCDVVDLFLDNNADVDALDKNSKRPFDLAMRNSHFSAAGRLVLAMHFVELFAFEVITVNSKA
ncbi:GA-binding protein subunit beta-2-like [Corticium candelabrum]|uniref:GA-binding protein subunit beta-2-like n=1 Tax=Corticium candelabrum TaxID=121492 RepID=UPI002E2676EA|nr:GA-binding protein subunit beta-2-like [Corticium candelabrum]